MFWFKSFEVLLMASKQTIIQNLHNPMNLFSSLIILNPQNVESVQVFVEIFVLRSEISPSKITDIFCHFDNENC